MKIQSRIFASLGMILISGLFLAGCLESKVDTSISPANSASGAIDKKVGDTSLSGTISQSGDQFILTIAGQSPKTLDSYKIDLKLYAGKKVKVTSQYSGDTLFVSSIE